MGLFSKQKKSSAQAEVCGHEELDPRWDSMEDAGITDRIDHYICRRCAVRVERPAADSGD